MTACVRRPDPCQDMARRQASATRGPVARTRRSALQALQEQLAPVKGLGPDSVRLARFTLRLGTRFPHLKPLVKVIFGH